MQASISVKKTKSISTYIFAGRGSPVCVCFIITRWHLSPSIPGNSSGEAIPRFIKERERVGVRLLPVLYFFQCSGDLRKVISITCFILLATRCYTSNVHLNMLRTCIFLLVVTNTNSGGGVRTLFCCSMVNIKLIHIYLSFHYFSVISPVTQDVHRL